MALICIAVSVRSLWMARADWLSNGSLSDVDRAIAMEPNDPNLLTIAAVYRSNSGDLSPEVDRALKRARQLNKLDSRIPIALGLRAEFRGDLKTAEAELRRAVDLDQQFRPSWTLANFYFRHDRGPEALPLLRHCLELEPLGYDPDSVFELIWNIKPDPQKAAALVPRRNPRLTQYLGWLVRTNRIAAAAGLWPAALPLVDTTSEVELATLRPLPGYLARGGHGPEGFQLWNRLIELGIIKAGRLDPARNQNLADPDFRYELTTEPFGWIAAENAGVISSAGDGYRFEMDGNEPEAFEMLHTTAAVLPGRNYNLRWDVDGDGMSATADPGFVFDIAMEGSQPFACPPLLAGGKAAGCRFTTPEKANSASVRLSYRRAPGTIRPHGVLRLHRVKLDLAP